MPSYSIDHQRTARWVRRQLRKPRSLRRRLSDAEKIFLAEFVRREDSVLDIGCGYGREIRSIAVRAKSVTCLDSSADALRDARRLLKSYTNVRFVRANAEKMPLPAKSVSVVLLLVTFGNLGSDVLKERILRDVRRVLVDGGRIGISVWRDTASIRQARLKAYRDGLSDNVTILKKTIYIDGTPSEDFSAARLRRLLSTAGFRRIRIHPLSIVGFFAEGEKVGKR